VQAWGQIGAAIYENPAGEQLIRAEAAKSARHLPLRKVFAKAADVLTAVCPCWMAQPALGESLLVGGKRDFDFVIFDEASQVLSEDAVPAILRGENLVVAGDSKQLPPTTFFSVNNDDELTEEDAVATEGYESLLDTMNAFLNALTLNGTTEAGTSPSSTFQITIFTRIVSLPFQGPVARQRLTTSL